MDFFTIWFNIEKVVDSFLKVCNHTYNMIVNNTLLLAFVLMCSIFVGLSLIKRLIHIK